jgi:hypothetical protein
MGKPFQPSTTGNDELMCVTGDHKIRRMEKTQGYLREEELDALRQAADRAQCRGADTRCNPQRSC